MRFYRVACDLIPLAVLKYLNIDIEMKIDLDVACDLIPLAVLKLFCLTLK